MAIPDWAETLPIGITICDAAGCIVEMNERASTIFEADGGRALVGRNVLDCHPEPARSRLTALLRGGRSNTYTIEKKGRRKLIAQLPYTRAGDFAGLVELSIELPDPMAHFTRK